jgi:hypothetical protein
VGYSSRTTRQLRRCLLPRGHGEIKFYFGFLLIKSKGSIFLTSAAPAKKPQKMAGTKRRLRRFSLVPGFGWCAQGFTSFIALRPAFTAKTAGKSIYKFLFRNV